MLTSGVDRDVTITFYEDVFFGSSIERERDARVTLADLQGSSRGTWNGRYPEEVAGAISSGRVEDARSLVLGIRTDSLALGVYKLTIIADAAGACQGPWGETTLQVT